MQLSISTFLDLLQWGRFYLCYNFCLQILPVLHFCLCFALAGTDSTCVTTSACRFYLCYTSACVSLQWGQILPVLQLLPADSTCVTLLPMFHFSGSRFYLCFTLAVFLMNGCNILGRLVCVFVINVNS